MKNRKIEISFIECDRIEELSEQDQKILSLARNAREKAYAPYSGFRVGSAVLLENGIIINGNNQENAAYPSGLCAEKVALFYAAANYPEIPIKTIAISGSITENHTVIKPCGSCCQVMAEYEDLANSTIKIILDGENLIQVIEGVDNLLPFRFKRNSLL